MAARQASACQSKACLLPIVAQRYFIGDVFEIQAGRATAILFSIRLAELVSKHLDQQAILKK